MYVNVAVLAETRAREGRVALVPSLVARLVKDSMLICFVYAGKEEALVQRLVDRRITCFAMERLPRISRAQSMDALSSPSAPAGYHAVQLGSTHLGRILPKVTTAAGVIGPRSATSSSRASASRPARASRVRSRAASSRWRPATPASRCATRAR